MVIHKKRGLVEASLKYIREGKPKYTQADIIAFKIILGLNKKKRRSGLKIVLGGALVVVGVVTLPIPCGSLFLIGAGCSLMVDGGFDLWRYYRKAQKKADSFLFGVGLR